MTNFPAPAVRAGQANAQEGTDQLHTLLVLANDHHGALDRIVGVLRRRRAKMQTFTIGRSEIPDVVRITIVMNDSEVGVEQLVEQLRKVVDVRHIVNLSSRQTIARQLALIKVKSDEDRLSEIIDISHHFGAHVVDVSSETTTIEVTGSEEKVEKLVSQLQTYGILEIARTGFVAVSRGTGKIDGSQ